MVSTVSQISAVRLHINRDINNSPPPPPPIPPPSKLPSPLPHLSLSKPSWIVKTESNVHREVKKKPDRRCVICEGTGRVDCHYCYGKGRKNYTHLVMLPKGEWPKWCKACGGSGLTYCARCLGTGEYRYIMGFQFMRRDFDDIDDRQDCRGHSNPGPHIAADQLLNGNNFNGDLET